MVAQPSGEFAVFQQEADQASELLGVFWGGLKLMLEPHKSATPSQKPTWLRAWS